MGDRKYTYWDFAGLLLTPLRICTGWLLFSAMWRRVVLKPESLDVLSPLYEGLKFNHFVVSASGIGPMIKFLVAHPELLFVFLWIFTIIEGLLGLGLMFGLLTRLAGLGSFLVLFGIMMGAGWLGTTCVDEWQIGIFGMASGIVLFFSGGGPLSLDTRLLKNTNRFWQFLSSGPLFTSDDERKTLRVIIPVSLLLFAFTLLTNQVNVGGVWGPFKNPAVKPHIVLSNGSIDPNGRLKFTISRNGGPDTYGAFITEINLIDESGTTVRSFNGKELGTLPEEQIHNKYLVKVRPDGQSLLVPLAGDAEIDLPGNSSPSSRYTLQAVDISNAKWETKLGPR